VAPSDLPVTPSRSEGTAVEINTIDEVAVLNQITGWALERRVTLTGLDVTRKTLEDVYLALTHEEAADASGAHQ
ncbi:MAG TPA: hypothetical protein VMV11_06590, partial [Acidimicrobiales bacterium]|nr:hypothetical protein [Acidimicrobiales bacterium]